MNISGHFVYKGLAISQHPRIEEPFKMLIKNIRPKRILEIGTAHGGLTLLIRDILDENGMQDSTLRTYDVIDSTSLQQHINAGAKIERIMKTIFDDNYQKLILPDEVREYIQSDGTTIVLCDGGNKKNEFNLLSQFLKSGDIIMGHDYSRNEEHFRTVILNKVWNWFELQYSDIQSSVDAYGLIPFMKDEFENVVWVCMIKK